MKSNVGGVDRILRSAIGISLIAWGIMDQNMWGAIGAIPLFTAVIGWCPAYIPFGLNTGRCHTK